jgi:hypothetical protein
MSPPAIPGPALSKLGAGRSKCFTAQANYAPSMEISCQTLTAPAPTTASPDNYVSLGFAARVRAEGLWKHIC